MEPNGKIYTQYQPPQLQQPKKSRAKAVLLAILALVLIGGAGAGAYFYQQQRIDTLNNEKNQLTSSGEDEADIESDTSAFTAQNLPFSFKRPAGWSLHTEAQLGIEGAVLTGTSYELQMFAPNTIEAAGGIGAVQLNEGATIGVDVESKPQQKSVAEIANSNGFSEMHREKTDTTVAGQPAIEYLYVFEGPRRLNTIFFKDGVEYRIYYEAKWNDENLKTGENYKLYQEIVKSFTFK